MLKNRILFATAFLILIVVITCSFNFQSQSRQKLFLIEYTKGSAWNEAFEFSDQKFASHHSKHLRYLMTEKLVQFGARYADKGIIHLKASDISSANQIVLSDSSVINKIFRVSINELDVFYDGMQFKSNQKKNTN